MPRRPTSRAGATTSTLRCDGVCGEPLSVRAWRWSCTLCDYDVCRGVRGSVPHGVCVLWHIIVIIVFDGGQCC